MVMTCNKKELNGPFDLSRYHISLETGCLLENPLEKLPEHFAEWNDLALNIPALVKQKRVREAVHKLPLLDHSLLVGHRQLRLAHLQLSLITSAYVWQDGDDGVSQNLPSNIAIPFYEISKCLGVQPVLGHVDLCLANWKLIDPKGGYDFSNLQCLYDLPGGRHGQWFVIVTCMVEFAFAKCLKYIIQCLNLMNGSKVGSCSTERKMTECLNNLSQVIPEMQRALAKMHDELDAKVFFNVMRPFLGGWGGDGNALPDGLIYTGVCDKPIKLPGGSAAQSSSLQILDGFLGVKHKEDKRAFLTYMRDFMPPDHRRFIEDIETNPHQLRDFVETSKNRDLLNAYNQCLLALLDLRNYHIQVVTKYVIVAARETNEGNYQSLDSKGTGGTSLIPFLKVIRSDTGEKLLRTKELRSVSNDKLFGAKVVLGAASVLVLTASLVVGYLRRT